MNLRVLSLPLLLRAGATEIAPHGAVRRRTAAGALAVGVVAFVAVQLALGAVSSATRFVADPVYADKEARLTRLERATPHGAARVWLLGTSRTGYGFDAGRVPEIAARSGVRVAAFNFGVPGAGPITHLIYLRRLLNAGHRPELLFVEVLVPLLADTPGGPVEGRMLRGDLLTREEIDLATRYGLPREQMLRQWRDALLLPVYEHRFKLLGRALSDALPWQLRHDAGRIADSHGWTPSYTDEISPELRQKGIANATLEYRGRLEHDIPAGPAATALRDLLRLCRTERIPVALVLFPEASDFRALYPSRVEPKLQRYLGDLRTEFGYPVTDARTWVADDRFNDGHHLLRPGAEQFTERFVRESVVPLLKERVSRGERE